jgi:hypothetical protein
MSLYSSVNRGIYGHMDGARVGGEGGLGPQYICRLRVTEEYIPIYSLVTHNQRIYSYISWYRGI